MKEFGYTINISPKKRLSGDAVEMIDCLEAYHSREFVKTKVVQYERLSKVVQQDFTLELLALMKRVFEEERFHIEYGGHVWEYTQAGNLHIHGHFCTSDPLRLDQLIEAISVLNSMYSSGKTSQCFYFTETHRVSDNYWTKVYMQKDQPKDKGWLNNIADAMSDEE